MRRLLTIVAGAMVIAGVAGTQTIAASGTQATKPAQEKTASAKTQKATGVVTAVSGTSLTVKTASGEVTYAVDEKTTVIGRGAGTKSREKKAAGEKTPITDFVANGDRVEVTYHDMGTTKHAATVRVTRKATT